MGNYLREKWRENFAGHLTEAEQKEIYLNSFLWHIFSWKKVNCLEKGEAIKAFENQIKKKCTIFYQFTDEAYLIENAKTLKVKDLPYIEDRMDYSDIYVLDWDNNWTFIMTHEMCNGLGPYYIQKAN